MNKFLLTILFLLLHSINIQADETKSDYFGSSLENWSGTGISRVSKSSSYRMRIEQDRTATKTFDFGSSYANNSVTIDFDLILDDDWEASGGAQDYFYVIANDVELLEYSNYDGTYSHSLSTTADSNGEVELKFRTNTTASGEYAYIDNIEITALSSGSITACPGEIISELNATSTSASKTYSHVDIDNYTTHYYYFTPSVDGTVQVDLSTDKTYNSLYIKNGCSTNLYSSTADSTSKSSSEISVSANDQIIVAVYRRYSSAMEYDLDISFTAASVAVGCDDSLDTSANDSAPGVLITSMNNITVDTTACISGTSPNNDSEYYYFSVATDGTLDITTSSPNSHDFHLKIGSTPDGNEHYGDTTAQAHGVSQISLSSGDSVYIYAKETGSDDDQFQINFDFKAVEAEDANTSTITNGYRDFTLRKSFYTKGNMKTIGNTILVPPTTQTSGICSTYTNSSYTSNASNANNHYELCGYQVDAGTTSSTTAELDLPSGAEIQWAGLYWQSIVKQSDYDFSNQMTIQIKNGSDSYVNVTSTTLDYNDENYQTSGGSSTYSYSAFVEVTDVLSANNWEDGNYTVANIPTYEGVIDSLGTYGAWTLVVIYSDIESATEKLRSFSVFDGWKVVRNDDGYRDVQIDVSGFYTPDKANISASLSVFAAEGDKNIANDKLTTINKNTSTTVELLTEADQTFNSSISGGGARVPELINNNGIDIQTYDIGSYLAPLQSSMEFHFTSNQDTYWPSVLAFATEIYDPDFCYDYAYKQNNYYFTEQNDGSYTPKIIGSVTQGSPVEVSIYIRNQEDSDVVATNTVFSIFDINTSQASYSAGSTKVTYPLALEPLSISDGEIDTSSAYIKDIPIGNVDGEEYFYVYYNLDLNSSYNDPLDMPIIGHYSYDLVLPTPEGTTLTLPYTTVLNDSLPICTDANFKYLPAYKIFNVVQEDLFESGAYYNIPTQVVQRPGRFNVVSFDADDIHLESPVSTMVAVELIDAGAFHDTAASCYEPDSAISPRLWVTFENSVSRTDFNETTIASLIANNLTSDYILDKTDKISQAREFYEQVRENTAFRVLWNRIGGSTDLIQTEQTASGIRISNFNTISATYPTCKQEVINPDTGTLTSTTSDVCTDKGASSTHLNIAACMECIIGYNTEVVCSRDNFAIRPESFNIQVYDTNQSDTDQRLHILQNHTGVTSPTTTREKLASGYIYGFDINATNHYSNSATSGYTKSFASGSEHNMSLLFEPTSVLNCNDTSNKYISFNIINGSVSTEDSLEQVGDYRLNMIDSSWTKVDHDPDYMTHHVGTYFVGSDATTKECLADSSVVQAAGTVVSYNGVNLVNVNGCNISSNHDNDVANLKYRDYNLTFLPYKINLTNLIPSYGNGLITNFPLVEPKARTYMSSLSNDNNISFNLIGQIQATSFTGNILSNFSAGCYAKDVNVSLNVTLPNDGDEDVFGHRIKVTDLGGNSLYTSDDTSKTFTIGENNFSADLNGSLNLDAKYSYDRNISDALNPKEITLNSLAVRCSTTSECQMNTDFLSDYENNDSIGMGYPLIFMYGRTHAPRHRFSGNRGTASIYYEVYCEGNDCNKSLLPDSTSSNFTDDPRWFVNTLHNSTNGTAGVVSQKDSTKVSVSTQPSGNHQDSAQLLYDTSRGYPYKTTMQNFASDWFIYNRYNSSATANEFEVEFENSASQWSGESNTDTTTKQDAANRTNRRSMW